MDAGKVALAIICLVGVMVVIGVLLSAVAGMYCFDHC